MPISPRYTWSQSSNEIEIIATIPGLSRNLLQHIIQITPIFFSLNFSPYLLQIDLQHEIDPFHIKVILCQKNEIKFVFPKKLKNQTWTDLTTTTDKQTRLKQRQSSIDELYKRQQAIRERREREKKQRLKAAQQRQWDEQKYLKHVMDKLERKEEQSTKSELVEWVKDTHSDRPDEDEKDEQKPTVSVQMPAIRESNVIEVGFSEWDYITPARHNTNPPEFARKTVINSKDTLATSKTSEISENTAIFLGDKGTQYFVNGDYQSAINAFEQALQLDPYDLEAYCNKLQCLIALNTAQSSADHLAAMADLVEKAERIFSEKEVKETDVEQVIFSLQKSVVATWFFLDRLYVTESKVDEERLLSTKRALERGLKLFDSVYQKLDAEKKARFGVFQDEKVLQDVHGMAMQSVRFVKLVQTKQTADKMVRNQLFMDAIDRYSEVIQSCIDGDDDGDGCHAFLSLLQYQCLCNRSTAYFSSKQFVECIQDCTEIIRHSHDVNGCKAYIKRAASYLSLWKEEKSNRDYLSKCYNDYAKAAEYDEQYASNAEKIHTLLSQT